MTGQGPVHNITKVRDTDRFYWVAKMAKDFVLMTGKETFSCSDLKRYFADRVFLNYLNEMQVTLFEHMEYVFTGQMNYSDLYFSDRVSTSVRDIPWMNRVRRDSFFLAKSVYYFMFTDFARTNDFLLFKEDLRNLSDFNTDPVFYKPIVDPKKYALDYFRSPEDPHIVHEHDFDNVTTSFNVSVTRRISEDFNG